MIPIVFTIKFVFGSLYALFFGWWLTDILANRVQREFEQRIQIHLGYLFATHGAKVVPNIRDTIKPGKYFAQITVAAEGVQLCLTEWHSELRVYVAPGFAPSELYDMSSVFMVVAPERWAGRRPTYVGLRDFGNLLYPCWDAVREAFTEKNYPEIKDKLDEIHDRDVRMTRRLEDQINRGLHGTR